MLNSVVLIKLFLVVSLVIQEYFTNRIFMYQAQSDSNRIKEFFEMVNNLEVDECILEQENFSLVPSVKPTVSELSEDAKELLSNLKEEINGENHEKSSLTDDLPPLWSELEEDGLIVEDEDCVTITDLEQDLSPDKEKLLKPFHTHYPSAKINDRIQGYQQWVVYVVGKDENYLHVSDGTKVWVKMKRKDVEKISIGDVLLLNVVRNDKEIELKQYLILETGISEDYMIPDEQMYIDKNMVI